MHIKEPDDTDELLALQPDEQYLVSSGRVYFRDLSFDQVRRLQVDLETTGLDAERDAIFMFSIRHPTGESEAFDVDGEGAAGEAGLIRRLVAIIQYDDPDVIENHNLHGFDLPFLEQRGASTACRSRSAASLCRISAAWRPAWRAERRDDGRGCGSWRRAEADRHHGRRPTV